MKPWLHSWRWVVAVVAAAATGWIVAGWRPGTDRSGRLAHEEGPVKPARMTATGIGRYEADFAAVAAAGNPAAQMAAAVALAGRIDPADFASFLENLRLLPAHSAQGLASRTVLRRWVAHDPAAALRWCATHDRDMIDGVLDEWALRTPSDQLAGLLDEIPANYRTQAVPSLFSALAKHDPEAAMALLAPYKPELAIHRLSAGFDDLARQDPSWLLQSAEDLPAEVRQRARLAAAKAMTEAARDDGIAWMMTQPDRRNLLAGLSDDPALVPSLLAAVAALPQGEQRGMHLSLHHLSWGGASEFIDAIGAHQGQLAEPLLRELLRNTGYSLAQAENPGVLANRLLAMEAGKFWNFVPFATIWANRSPEDARAWASALPDETQRRQAMDAMASVTRSEETTDRWPLAERLAEQFKHGHFSDPHQLLALGDDERRQVLEDGFRQFLEKDSPRVPDLAQHYPAEAARAVASVLTAENTATLMRSLTEIASHWAVADPVAAAQWAATLPPGVSRAWAAANVVEHWRIVDEPAARAWVESLPPDEGEAAATALRHAGQ
jgi:hypothetical protein